MIELYPKPRFDKVYQCGLENMNKGGLDDSDICVCGHNIHEHEAVNDCKCYTYGCQCEGFESDKELGG